MGIKRTLIKNSFLNLGSYAYLLMASFVSVPIILHSLGADMFGVYILIGSIIPLVSVLDLGLSSAVVREMSLPEITRTAYEKIWRTSFSLYLIGSFVIALGVLVFLKAVPNIWPIFSLVDQSTLRFLSLIIPLTVLFNHLNTHLLNLPQAKQRFEIYNLKPVIVGTGNTLITAVASYWTKNLGDLFLVQYVFHLITFMILFIYAKDNFSGWNFFPGFDKTTSVRLVRFGIKNFIGAFSNQVEAQMSKYVIGVSAPAVAITAFSIPQNVIMKAAGVVSQVALAIFPTSTSLLTKERLPKLKKLIWSVEVLTLVFGLVGVTSSLLFGEAFLAWWLKDEAVVRLAVPVLKIMSFYFLLTSLTPIPGVILVGLNLPQVPSFFSVLTTIIEIALLIFLVPTYHSTGAAIAVLATSTITVPLFLLVFFDRLRKHEKSISVEKTPFVKVVSPESI